MMRRLVGFWQFFVGESRFGPAVLLIGVGLIAAIHAGAWGTTHSSLLAFCFVLFIIATLITSVFA